MIHAGIPTDVLSHSFSSDEASAARFLRCPVGNLNSESVSEVALQDRDGESAQVLGHFPTTVSDDMHVLGAQNEEALDVGNDVLRWRFASPDQVMNVRIENELHLAITRV